VIKPTKYHLILKIFVRSSAAFLLVVVSLVAAIFILAKKLFTRAADVLANFEGSISDKVVTLTI